jgi:hypothetical protein
LDKRSNGLELAELEACRNEPTLDRRKVDQHPFDAVSRDNADAITPLETVAREPLRKLAGAGVDLGKAQTALPSLVKEYNAVRIAFAARNRYGIYDAHDGSA